MPVVQIKTELHFTELLKAVEQLDMGELEQLMSQVIALQAKRKASSLSKKESKLLLKINRGLPLKIQKRFNELTVKRQAETLTPSEHKELLNLIEQIENTDAERVRHMAELAQIRGISLKKLMKESKIHLSAHA